MALFNLPPRATKASDMKAVKKAGQKGATAGIAIKGGGGNGQSLLQRISTINAVVQKELGAYADKYLLVRTEEQFKDYIYNMTYIGEGSLDTETNSKYWQEVTRLAGVCLFAPGLKGMYAPMHHVSYVTGAEVDDQLEDAFVREQLERIRKVKLAYHNAKYDVHILEEMLALKNFPVWWDTLIAANCLDENEVHKLKFLWNQYCNQNADAKGVDYESLFEGMPFTHIPINTAYLYAAKDPEMTYELQQFQAQFLTPEGARCLPGCTYVFNEVEMPIIHSVVEMEKTGVSINVPYAQELSVKYTAQLKEKEQAFYNVCDMYADEINEYKRKNRDHKLSHPINIASPTQLAVLLYDILGLKSPEKNKPRGTGEEILEHIDSPFCKAILEYRTVAKLLSTYIDKLPGNINPKTGKIHASFNQYGAATGRFSSSDPNLQNIPSHNTDIRKMFVAGPGNVFISSDYSQQEPRILAHLSQDPDLIKAYREGKDIYAWISSLVYKLPYENCREKFPDGTSNPDGKKRRDIIKAIVLGMMYGKGVPNIAKDLGIPKKEAQFIYDEFFNTFPGVREFIESSQQKARDFGYVETAWGRKRRLPDMQLPDYELTLIGGGPVANFDPLFGDELSDNSEPQLDEAVEEYYIACMRKATSYKQREAIKLKAKGEGIYIKDNGGFIADAERQCVNSIIQGSAADMTKLAMRALYNSEKLRELECKMILPVHDELICEVPRKNAKEAAKIITTLMVQAADIISVPMKCDAEIMDRWYGESIKMEDL